MTDAGAAQLRGFPALRYLTIRESSIADAGLRQLGRIGTLKFLGIPNSEVTPEGVAEFRNAHPAIPIAP